MLKFFRKIRQNLLSDGNTGRYLKYAIGEIILVVIGILIALQINNWNEHKKLKAKEKLILNEILNSINKDLEAWNNMYTPRLGKKESALDSLYAYILNNRTISDSLFMEFYRDLGQDLYFRFDSGPFETLKSMGLDIIQSDTLRTAINHTYTTALPAYQYFAQEPYDRNKNEIRDLEGRIFNLIPIILESGWKQMTNYPKVKNILLNQDFYRILEMEQQKFRAYNRRIDQATKLMKDTKSMIELELGITQITG